MKLLRTRIYDAEKSKQDEARAKEEGAKGRIEFGNQIRSYVLHPYRMVKDQRTNHQTSQVDDVLDGDLDGFIKAYLLGKGKEASGSSDAGGDQA